MTEKDILRAELKKLRFPSMDDAKQALMMMHLRLSERGRIPTMYDLLTLSDKEAPEWYKEWGWPCITWELMSNKYGAAAKHGKDGKVSHFTVYLPPPVNICKFCEEKGINHEDSNESDEKP